MDVAVSMVARYCRIRPIMAGTMYSALTNPGLYQTMVRTSMGGFMTSPRPRRSRRSTISFVEWFCPTSVAAASAVPASVGSEPSMTNATCAESPPASLRP